MMKNKLSPNQNQFKTKKEIAAKLGINIKTLSIKLREAGLNVKRGLISPAVQKQIGELFGVDNL